MATNASGAGPLPLRPVPNRNIEFSLPGYLGFAELLFKHDGTAVRVLLQGGNQP